MSYVTIIWSVIASGSLLLAFMYGLVWVMDRKALAFLAFSVEALAIVGGVVVELGLMHSSSATEYGEWVRWYQLPILARTAAMVAFIWFYFETGRLWLAWVVVGSRLLIVIANFLVDPNFNFSHIDSVEQIRFLGEMVTVLGRAEPSPYQWIAVIASNLVLVFVIDASISLWRKRTPEARRKVIVIGGATVVSWAVASTYSQLLIYGGAARLPAMITPPYLIMLAAMTFEISRDALRASRLTRELRDSEARLKIAASAAGLGLWSWDAHTKQFWTTGRMHEMLALRVDEPAVLDRMREMIDPADMEHIRSVWREAAISGTEAEVQFSIRKPDGATRVLLARGRSHADPRGKLLTVHGVLRDVTEQIHAREENEELRRGLAHVGRVSVLGTLSSSLAHELSQPLGAILMNTETAELLLKRPNPDLNEIRQIFADIHRDDLRATEVIEGLRSLLRRGQMVLGPVFAEGLIRDVTSLLKSDAIVRRVILDCICDPGLPTIRGDKVHLTQVLINLVVNGMDAVAMQPIGHRRVTLRASTGETGGVEITVRDSGPGVPPELMRQIFEPFFTTKAAGMGMGLSVSRTIVQAHCGKLWADNAPEGGAIFYVSLPPDSGKGEG